MSIRIARTGNFSQSGLPHVRVLLDSPGETGGMYRRAFVRKGIDVDTSRNRPRLVKVGQWSLLQTDSPGKILFYTRHERVTLLTIHRPWSSICLTFRHHSWFRLVTLRSTPAPLIGEPCMIQRPPPPGARKGERSRTITASRNSFESGGHALSQLMATCNVLSIRSHSWTKTSLPFHRTASCKNNWSLPIVTWN
jgi:hypothetical protein